MAEAANVLADMSVPIRGDLTPLRNDLATARRELEAFNNSIGGARGAGATGGANSSFARMQRDLKGANDNVQKLTNSLNRMSGSASAAFTEMWTGAANVTASMDNFTSATNRAGTAADALAADTLASGAALDAEAAAVDRNTAAKGRNAAMSRFAANQQRILAYQLVDVTQMLAMGQAPLMTLIQQGPQIAQIYGPGEGGLGRAFRESARMVGSLITRMPVLSASLLVAGGAVFELWRGLREAGHETVTFGDVIQGLFQTIGEYVGNFLSPVMPYVSAAWDWLVSSVVSVGNEIIRSFQVVFNDLTFIFSQFGNIVATATESAVQPVITAIEWMVNKAIQGINLLIAGVNSLPEWVRPENLSELDPVSLDSWRDRSGQRAELEAAMAERLRRQQEIMASDPLGDFATNWRENTLDTMRNRESGSGRRGREREDPYQKLIEGSVQFIEQQRLEAQQLGMTSEAAARLEYHQQLLNEAQEAGIALTPQQRNELAMLAEEMAAAEEQTRRLNEAYRFGKDTFRGFFSDLKSDLQNGSSLWEAFGNAAANALDKIADKALDMAVNGIWDMIFNAAVGMLGGGGFGQFPGGFGSATPGVGLFANGTNYARGGWSVVGERGPELMHLPGGTQVVPNNRISTPAMPSMSGGAGGGKIELDVFVRDNGQLGAIARKAGREGAEEYVEVRITEYDERQLPQSVERINEKPRMR